MPAPPLNRRRFLGYSAAAGLALGNAAPAEGHTGGDALRLGFVGLGNRGTALLRTALELPGVAVAAVCDLEPRHRLRAQGIAEKASGTRPDACERLDQLLVRPDVDAVVAALPCDLHAAAYLDTIRAGKPLYAEKPLALTVAECEAIAAAAKSGPPVHVGFQRRFDTRLREAVARVHDGAIGTLVDCEASWISPNGPMRGHGGWLGRRARSGDWMLEQAVHLWDLLCWVQGGPPRSVTGYGRRDLWADRDPGRDVHDCYAAALAWSDGFFASLRHTWAESGDDRGGGLSVRIVGTSGSIEYAAGQVVVNVKGRPREVLTPRRQSDTHLALRAFVDAARGNAASHDPDAPNLDDATLATRVGLMVRHAIENQRSATWRDGELAG